MIKYLVAVVIAAGVSIVLSELGTPEFLNGWFSCTTFVVTVGAFTMDFKIK